MAPKDEAFALFQSIRMIQLRVRLTGKSTTALFQRMLYNVKRMRDIRDEHGEATVEAWRQEWLKTWSDK